MSSLLNPTTQLGLVAAIGLMLSLGVTALIHYRTFVMGYRGATWPIAVFLFVTQVPTATLGTQFILGYPNCACSVAEYAHAQSAAGNMTLFLAFDLMVFAVFIGPMHARWFRYAEPMQARRWLMYAYATAHIWSLAIMADHIVTLGNFARGERQYSFHKEIYLLILGATLFCCTRAIYIALKPRWSQRKAQRREPWWYYLQFIAGMWWPMWPINDPPQDDE